jgi:peptidyl-Lys metalloendopeptidase
LRVLIIALIFWLGSALPAAAQQGAPCTGYDAKLFDEAMRSAKDLTLRAAVAVGPTGTYERWFGAYTPKNAETVRATLKSVVTVIRSGAVTAQCEPIEEETCAEGGYAFVFPSVPYVIHLCPAFYTLPPLVALRPGQRASENGTRAGTIVHELSHFLAAAATDDHCYARRVCSEMAQNAPLLAIENADSYQYFTEDVTHFSRQPLEGKPPPAARVTPD